MNMTHRARGCPFIANVDGEDFVIDSKPGAPWWSLSGVVSCDEMETEEKERT